MAKWIGRRLSVGLGRETTRLVGVSPGSGGWLPHVDISFNEAVQEVISKAALNRIEENEDRVVVEKWAEGDISAQIRSKSFGYILTALAGAAPSTTGTGPYTHTFTLQNDNQHATLSIHIADPIGDRQFKGASLNSLEIKQELDDFAVFTANFLAKYPVNTSVTPSLDTSEVKFSKKDLSIKLASSIAGLSGASNLGVVEALTLSINKNVTRDSVFGSAEPVDFINNSFQVEGSLTLKYEDRTYRNYFVDNTERAMEIKWDNGTQSLTFQLPKVHFTSHDPDYSLDEVVRQDVGFTAFYDLANSQAILHKIELVNNQSSY